MATTLRRGLAAIALALVAVLVSALPAGAHNAGHFFLPDGTCQQVGSFLPAPLVGRDKSQLDLRCLSGQHAVASGRVSSVTRTTKQPAAPTLARAAA